MGKILGIDPGETGALAILDDARNVEIFDMPLADHPHSNKQCVDYPNLKAIVLNIIGLKGIIIEAVHAMPDNGVVSAFTFGVNYSPLICMQQEMPDMPFKFIAPSTWKAGLRLKKDGKDTKAAPKRAVQKLYPELPVQRHDRCEALLLAHYARGMGFFE